MSIQMQEEHEPANLKEIVENYLSEENYSDYPPLDLFIRDKDTVRDCHNNVIYTLTLWNVFCKKMGHEVEIDDQGNYGIEKFVGTQIRLLDWKLRTQKIHNSLRFDFRCKKFM